MNKNIKLAVAGAIFAAASVAQAGIIIPAGDWTLDINGNVNAFTNFTSVDRNDTITGSVTAVGKDSNGKSNAKGINTGLLPSWIGFTGKTRQNDLDVEFTISLQPSASENSYHGDGSNGFLGASVNQTSLNRQTYVSFGDKSWGSIKLGKDLGIYAAEAILNDMTLLGVGAGAAASGATGNTTLGGIGTGYQYAAWKGQVAYTTPNFNGFQATVGITNPNQGFGTANQDRFGMEGKASYSFSANDVTGKVWVSGASYDVTTAASTACTAGDLIATTGTVCATTTATNASREYRANVGDVGANLNMGPFGVTGYYYQGKGAGTTFLGNLGATAAGARRDSDGGYVQLTYVLPVKTKIGFAYGISNLDLASGESGAAVAGPGTNTTSLVSENERYTVGVYHPLTKHLNLVAEYNNIQSKAHNGSGRENQTYSAGAILFF